MINYSFKVSFKKKALLIRRVLSLFRFKQTIHFQMQFTEEIIAFENCV